MVGSFFIIFVFKISDQILIKSNYNDKWFLGKYQINFSCNTKIFSKIHSLLLQ